MNRITNTLAITILMVMALVAYGAAWNDVIVVDEDPHIAAGITYVDKRDMRMNPEHPPLVKWLAGIPVSIFQDLSIPYSHTSWTEDVNGQWEFGKELLFRSGNDADAITRLARLAPLALMVLLGWFIYRWAAERRGAGTGIIALLLYATSPTILAHGVLVTTDVPAALGIFVGTYYFLRFLKAPTRKTLIIAGVAFGLAQLLKFSVALLIPYFGLLAFGFWLLKKIAIRHVDVRTKEGAREVKRPFATYVLGTVLIGVIGLAVIYLVYFALATSGYPAERQLADTMHHAASFPIPEYGDVVVWMAQQPLLRPIAQYFLGLGMVIQRAAGGNTTYFMGMVDNQSWLAYFPVVYLVKIRLAVHLMTLLVLFIGLTAVLKRIIPLGTRRVVTAGTKMLDRVAHMKLKHFDELSMVFFILVYWYSSLTSNLNIGVRHLSPTLPFLFVLIAIGLSSFVKLPVSDVGRFSFKAFSESAQRVLLVGILIVWALIAGLAPFPHYLSSFNELAELREGGENIVTDSNLDWGQDLKRLAWFIEERGIETIYLDYFGWADPKYYITTANIEPWWANGKAPDGWLAVSASFKQQACAEPTERFVEQTGFDGSAYCYLDQHDPVTIIGDSIYVYHFSNSANER